MPRLINPVGWSLLSIRQDDLFNPLITLQNTKGHLFHLQPINQGLIRVVYSLPYDPNQPRLRNHQRNLDEWIDGFHWEERKGDWSVNHIEEKKEITITAAERIYQQDSRGQLQMHIDFSYSVNLTWSFASQNGAHIPFLKDFKNAYTYDVRTQRVYHQVCRQQSYMPLSEHILSANGNGIPQEERFEFIYGLGETKGCMMKDGKRYMIDARDSLAADPQETDPLYKLCPFYLHYNLKTKIWYGLYYNTLSPSIFDFSGEHDFATGEFRSFSAEAGPLDYYLLLGESQNPASPSVVARIVSQFARLVTPYSTGPAGDINIEGWQASPTLPPLSQFGYLASSFALSERPDAQKALMDYVKEARENGFPIDSMHLSSGYAVDSQTGDRNYFTWDPIKYPDPETLGKTLEDIMRCKVIINVKPWLLETHASCVEAANKGACVRAAPDARPCKDSKGEPRDVNRCGRYSSEPARTMHWSKGMGETDKGSYFDFTSRIGCQQWHELMEKGVLDKSITGFWIDINEFSSLIDDEEEIKGEIDLWNVPRDALHSYSTAKGIEVSRRMGWGCRPTSIGSVGRAVLTMGMARATYERLYAHLNGQRPIIVTRSAVPGIQAFAHASWSGDNSTSWLSLKWSTKSTLSVGLSFGVGLYGHDIGGFAGPNSPSSELLIRWCQQSMWHTRFTIHSWEKVTTTPWMYGKEETVIIRKIIQYRYRLIPMLYSLYVVHYHRKGWPVLKPMLWYHSKDWKCLTLDEQFLVGSHVLVAPVCTHQQFHKKVYLPHQVDGDNCEDACWYEVEEHKWHRPSRLSNEVTLFAPIDRLPTLVRDGGMIVLGPMTSDHVPLPQSRQIKRDIQIFPTPADILRERKGDKATSSGSFILIDDDGISNEATHLGHFTQMRVFFEANCDVVVVGAAIEVDGYAGHWDLTFVLPPDDQRRLVGPSHSEDLVISSDRGTSFTVSLSIPS